MFLLSPSFQEAVRTGTDAVPTKRPIAGLSASEAINRVTTSAAKVNHAIAEHNAT